jgi:hypothetical protein
LSGTAKNILRRYKLKISWLNTIYILKENNYLKN